MRFMLACWFLRCYCAGLLGCERGGLPELIFCPVAPKGNSNSNCVEMCYSNNFWCCCGVVSSIFYACVHLLQGLILLLPLLVNEVILFSILVSVCVGLTAILSFFHEICWYRPLPADVQAVIALIFLTALGEGSTLMLRGSYLLRYYKRLKQSFPWILKLTTRIFILSTIGLAISHLYFGYKSAHPSYYLGNKGNRNVDLNEAIDPETLNATSTFLVLLCLSYLTYNIPRMTDWMAYRFRMNPADYYTQLGSKLYVASFLIQLFLLAIYSVPLLVLAYACHFIELSPVYVFPVIILNGIGIGINVGQLENIYIVRFGRMQPPNYPYENYLAARVNLFQYILIPLVAITYYGTGPIRSLTPAGQFYMFTIMVSVAALQATKCAFTDQYLGAVNHFRRMLRNNRIQRFLAELEQAQANQAEAEEPTPQEVSAEGTTNDVDKNANNIPVPIAKSSKENIENQTLDEMLQNVQAGGNDDAAPESLEKPGEKLLKN